MDNSINNLNTEKIKVLELIYNSIPPDEDEVISHIILTKNDFDRQSVSIDTGYSILKEFHQEKIIKLLSYIDNDFDIILYTNENIIKECLDILKKNAHFEKVIFSFNKKDGFLIINDFKIHLSERNSKTISHHIIEFIFDNDLEQSFYSEIADSIYHDEEYKPYKYHNACERLQEKIRKKTGIDDFLVFSSGNTGSVQINKNYL